MGSQDRLAMHLARPLLKNYLLENLADQSEVSFAVGYTER